MGKTVKTKWISDKFVEGLFQQPFFSFFRQFMNFYISKMKYSNKIPKCTFLYLGLGASALCFVTWNLAVKVLGAVKTSVYIYMVPVIMVVASVLILKEPVTWVSIMGTVLAVAGLLQSLSLPMLSENAGGENFQRTGGLKDGFTE